MKIFCSVYVVASALFLHGVSAWFYNHYTSSISRNDICKQKVITLKFLGDWTEKIVEFLKKLETLLSAKFSHFSQKFSEGHLFGRTNANQFPKDFLKIKSISKYQIKNIQI